jgi:hypothetical protein
MADNIVQASNRVDSTSEQVWQTKSKQQAAELTVRRGQATTIKQSRQYVRATSMVDRARSNYGRQTASNNKQS